MEDFTPIVATVLLGLSVGCLAACAVHLIRRYRRHNNRTGTAR